MANRKHSDAHRFGFCTRCLQPAGPNRLLLEHHVLGRKNAHAAIVFICHPCNPHVENNAGPIPSESHALSLKRDLLVQSCALRWVVSKWQQIFNGLVSGNKSGVGLIGIPGAGEWQPPFGAVGQSGRKYYFIPPEHLDKFVEVPTSPTWNEDGLGGPACDANWVRFKGAEQNILNKFLDVHRGEGSPGIDLEMLRQN